MSTRITCANCAKAFAAPEHLAGKTVKCPSCCSPLKIPASVPEPSLGSLLDGLEQPSSFSGTSALNALSARDRVHFATTNGFLAVVVGFIKNHVLMTIIAAMAAFVLFLALIHGGHVKLGIAVSSMGFGTAALGLLRLRRPLKPSRTESDCDGLTTGQKWATGGVVLSMIGAICKAIARFNRTEQSKKLSNADAEQVVAAIIGIAAVVGVIIALVILIRRFGVFRVVGPIYITLATVLIVAYALAISDGSMRSSNVANVADHDRPWTRASSPRSNSPTHVGDLSDITLPQSASSSARSGPLDPLEPLGIRDVKTAGEWSPADTLAGKVRRSQVWLKGDSRVPGSRTQIFVYSPAGFSDAPNTKQFPCVLVAPAGSNLLSGTDAGPGADAECTPWARAGYLVVLYSLDGAPVGVQGTPTLPQIKARYEMFSKARAGLANFEHSLQYVMQHLPQVDQSRIAVVGHSSAGTLALLAAESNAKIKACVAFAPCSDVCEFLDANLLAALEPDLPGVTKFAADYSPNNHVERFKCPLFLFHAEDDSVTPIATSIQFAKQMAEANKQVEFKRVTTGNHHDSMIREGIPSAIAWLNSKFGHIEPERIQERVRNPLEREPQIIPAHPRTSGPLARPTPDSFDSTVDGVDYGEKAKHALRFGTSSARDFLRAMVVSGDDATVSRRVQLSPVLKRPAINLEFVLAVEGDVGDDRPGPKNLHRGEANTAMHKADQLWIDKSFCDATGDVGMWLIEGLQSRVDRGSFGDWGHDLSSRWKTERRGITIAPAGTEDGLLEYATVQRADVLVAAKIDVKRAVGGKGTATLKLRIFDVLKKTEIWTSKPLTSSTLAIGRRKGEDPAASLVEDALSFVDDNLKLKPIPNLKSDLARRRAANLTDGPMDIPLIVLAELRYYQAKKLIDAKDAEEFYSRILSKSDAHQLASGDAAARRRAIEKLTGPE